LRYVQGPAEDSSRTVRSILPVTGLLFPLLMIARVPLTCCFVETAARLWLHEWDLEDDESTTNDTAVSTNPTSGSILCQSGKTCVCKYANKLMIGSSMLADAPNTPVYLRPRRNSSFLVRHSSTMTESSPTSSTIIELVPRLYTTRMVHSRCRILLHRLATTRSSRRTGRTLPGHCW